MEERPDSPDGTSVFPTEDWNERLSGAAMRLGELPLEGLKARLVLLNLAGQVLACWGGGGSTVSSAAAKEVGYLAASLGALACGEPVVAEGGCLAWTEPVRCEGRVIGALGLIREGEEIQGWEQPFLAAVERMLRLELEGHSFLPRLATMILKTTANAVVTVDRRGQITYLNEAAERLFALKREEVVGRTHAEVFHGGKVFGPGGEYLCKLTEVLDTGRAFTQMERVYPDLAPNTFFSVDALPFFDHEGRLVGAMGVYRDITRQKQAEKDLQEANRRLQAFSTGDLLTGLYNRQYFEERLSQEIARAKRLHTPLSLIVFDVDYFRQYCEQWGERQGDQLLVELARVVQGEARAGDVVGRLHEDEFALLLLDTPGEQAIRRAENLRQTVAAYPFSCRDRQPGGHLTISVGVASYPTNADSAEELLRVAREALFQAKETSRNRVELYFSVLGSLRNRLDASQLDLLHTVRTLITVINAKDRYTYGHTERVVRYAANVARAAGLGAGEVAVVELGGFLHDIGKIEISRDILNKREPLTREEWEILRQHPVWGAEIIKPVGSLAAVVPIVLYHHERFDGKGYPEGLAGEEIPLAARLLAIVDAYDAMTTNRPYKRAKTTAEAIEEMERWAGKQFDPDLLQVFLEVLRHSHGAALVSR